MNTIDQVADLSGKRVLIRASLNVALDESQQVIDELRLVRTLDTINYVLNQQAIPILLSHINNGTSSTLKPIASWYANQGYQVEFIQNYIDQEFDIEPGTLYLLENLRDHEGEKQNSDQFAWKLAQLGDVFVNESFDSAHRAHASTVGLAKILPAYAGINFSNEVSELARVFNPDRPFTFIIGGAKFETKVPLIKKLLEIADKVFIGGALMNPLLMSKGSNIGQSLLPDKEVDLFDIVNHPNLVLPMDFIDQDHKVLTIESVTDSSRLLDIGPDTITALELMIEESDLVVWNGPLGNYEAGFSKSTDQIAVKLSQMTDTYSVIGGGDTLAAVDDQVEKGIDWLSTGGGAMLDFIESDGSLPAIEVLNH